METTQHLKDAKREASILWDSFHTAENKEAELFNKALASVEAQETTQVLSTDINTDLIENVQKAISQALRVD